VILSALALGASTGGADGPTPSVFTGLGTWIDIYSSSFRADPERVVRALTARGVGALFVETGNYRQRLDLVNRRQLGRLIDAAHAQHISVVAWYLPALQDPGLDLRRALAAVHFVSPADGRFDAFALDIEATVVRNAAARTRRLIALSGRLRAAVGPQYRLGAIIPSPVGMKLLPRYWPDFPYRALSGTYDAFLPMAYYSYRAHGRAAVTRYVQTAIGTIRTASGDAAVPIHVIGGLAAATSAADVAAFARIATSCGVQGLSLYDFDATKPSMWPLLRGAAGSARAATRC
jgi:hypothetical protein